MSAIQNPLLGVLKVFIDDVKEPPEDSPISHFLELYPIPKIDFKIVEIFQNKFSQSHDLFQSFTGFQNVFIFKPDKVSEFLSMKIKNEDVLYTKYFIYSNALGFLLSKKDSDFHENLFNVLRMMFILTGTDENLTMFDLYLVILEFALKTAGNEMTEDSVLLICQHLLLFQNPSLKAFDLCLELYAKAPGCKNHKPQILVALGKLKGFLIESNIDFDDKNICDYFMKEIENLTDDDYKLISLLSQSRDSANLKKLYSCIANYVVNCSKNCKIELNFSSSSHFEYSKFSRKGNDIDSDATINDSIENIETNPDWYKNIFSQDYLKILDSLLNIYKYALDNSYYQAFFDIIGKQVKKNNETLLISFLYILSNIEVNFTLSENVCSILFNLNFFNPNVTVFYKNSDFDVINEIRNVIIKVIFKHNPEFMDTIFNDCKENPFLFSELLIRSLNYDISSLFTAQFLNNFLLVDLSFRQIYTVIKEDRKKLILAARTSLYFFLFELLKIPSLPFKSFKMKKMSDDIFAIVSEKSFKNKFFKDFKNSFQTKTISYNSVFQQIANLLIIFDYSDYLSPLQSLVSQFLEFVIDTLKYNEKIIQYATRLIVPFLKFLNHFHSQDLLIKIFDFLSLLPLENCQSSLYQLTNQIPKIERNLSDIVIKKMFYLSSIYSPLNLSEFLIQNPFIFNLILSIYSYYSRTNELLDIINKLCNYSNYNKIQLHNAEFDLLILDILLNYPQDFQFRGCKIHHTSDININLLLKIFMKISTSISSNVVAERLLKVLFHSNISEKLVNFLTPISKTLNDYQTIYYPLGVQQIYFEIEDLKVLNLLHGATIGFWIYSDFQTFNLLGIKSSILRASTMFDLIIQGKKLSFVSTTTKHDLPLLNFNEWNSIIINFKLFNTSTIRLEFFINSESPVSFDIKIKNYEDVVAILFGNFELHRTDNYKLLLSVYQLSFFAFYSDLLTNQEREQFIKDGHYTTNIIKKPQYMFPENHFNLPLNKTTLFVEKSGNYHQLRNLLHIFGSEYPLETIAPFFKSFNNFKNNLVLLKSIEQLFLYKIDDVFELASMFLPKSESKSLTFILYNNFYEMSSYSSNKEFVFDQILLNFDIWIQSPAKELMKILNHWSTELFNKFQDEFLKCKFVQEFLSNIRIYFYIENEGNENSKNPKRDPNLDIHECISILLEILHKRFLVQFSHSDITSYLTQLIKCKDFKLTFRLLKSIPELFPFSPNTNASKFLHAIDIDKNPELLSPLIHAFYFLSGNDFYHNITILSYQKQLILGYELFKNDINLYNELFGVSLMAALNFSSKIQDELSLLLFQLSNIKSSRDVIKKCDLWYIWPIIFSVQTLEISAIRICQFLANLVADDFSLTLLKKIISFWELVQLYTSLDAHSFKVLFLKFLYEQLRFNNSESFNEGLIDIGFSTLFVRTINGTHSYDLLCQYYCSQFNINEKMESKVDKIFNISQIKECFSKPIQFKHTISLRKFSEFSIVEKEFYQFYMKIVPKEPKSTFPQRIFNNCATYSICNNYERIYIIESFNKIDEFLDDYLESLNQSVLNEFKIIQKFLMSHEEQLKNARDFQISDPKIISYNNHVHRKLLAKQKWQQIIQKYIHPRALFDLDCFQYKRDFFFSPIFISNRLKRSLTFPKTRIKCYPNTPTKIIISNECNQIKISEFIPCIFNLTQTSLVIKFEYKTKVIDNQMIKYILYRYRSQKLTALEFFFINGRSMLFDFAPLTSDEIMSKIIEKENIEKIFPNIKICGSSDIIGLINASNIVKEWRKRDISNLEFLLKLNILCGRSYHDPENYIILPWVVNEKNQFRNLNLPIAAQTKEKIEYYRHMLQINKNNPDGAYVFGSAPSSAMLLAYYLVRQQPFKELHCQIHDGHLDSKERLFYSLDNFFSGLNKSDESRESIPEFYSMPEAFYQFDSEAELKTLELPKWGGSIFEYIYLNKKHIESDEVSAHLNQWIDLIFGVCQTGKEAVERCNLFLPYLYNNVWEKQPLDKKELILTMLNNLGSLPPQLFKTHFPERFLFRFNTYVYGTYKFDKKEDILQGFTFSSSKYILIAIFIDSRGDIIKYKINTETHEITFIEKNNIGVPKSSKSILIDQSLYILDSEIDKIYIVASNENKTIHVKLTTIDFINHGFENNLFFGSKMGVFSTLNTNKFDKPKTLIRVLSDSLHFSYISSDFGVIACSTNDGFIELYSITSKRFINSIFLENSIGDKIIITKSMGFIVVKTSSELWIFTINCILIKRVPLEVEIDRWITWKDLNGFDMICFADKDGRLYIFEAFYPENIKLLTSFQHSIIGLSYEKSTDKIEVITSEPSLNIVSYS